ncbi:hypothetical protein F5887DRAFT_1188529 [Amanita rubescens]|nr:hypothetical protein F5887DRAFT_1188529 [Amanita rubescens]
MISNYLLLSQNQSSVRVKLLSPALLRAQLFPRIKLFSTVSTPLPERLRSISLATASPYRNLSQTPLFLPASRILMEPLPDKVLLPFSTASTPLPERLPSIGLATVSPYRNLLQTPLFLPCQSHPNGTSPRQSATTSTAVLVLANPSHNSVPESMLVFDVETMPKEGHPYPVIAISALYAWISPWTLGESSSPVHFIPFGPDTDRLVVGHNITFDRARIVRSHRPGKGGRRAGEG